MNIDPNFKEKSNSLSANKTAVAKLSSSATPLNIPLLVRTTLLSTTQNFDPKFYPKLHFKIFGDLSSVSNIEFWTPSEIQDKRRLVIFKNLQQLPNILNIYFSTLPQHEMDYTSSSNQSPTNNNVEIDKKIVISCIFNETDQNYYITSVDLLYLLEQLLNSRFSIDEKNRIRRNLQTLKPETITKQNNFEFFNQIMGYSNPKPRNIEKNFKVFNWNSLNKALSIIMNKYSCDFYNVLNINLNNPSDNKQKKKKSSRPSSSGGLNHNIISNNSNFLVSPNTNVYSYMQTNKSNTLTNINGINSQPSRQLSLPSIVSTNIQSTNDNFTPPSSSASASQALINKTRMPSVSSNSSLVQSPDMTNNNENVITSQLISSSMVYFPNKYGSGLQNTVNTMNTTSPEANFYYPNSSANSNIKRESNPCDTDHIVMNSSSAFNSLPSELVYSATATPSNPVRTINSFVDVPDMLNNRADANPKISSYSELNTITKHPVDVIANSKQIPDSSANIINNRDENNNNNNGNQSNSDRNNDSGNYNYNNNINTYNEKVEHLGNTTKLLKTLIHDRQVSSAEVSHSSMDMNNAVSLRINTHNNTPTLANHMVIPVIDSSKSVNANGFMPHQAILAQQQHMSHNYIQHLPQQTFNTDPQAHGQIQPQATNYESSIPQVPLNISTMVQHINMVNGNNNINANFEAQDVQQNCNNSIANQNSSFNSNENNGSIHSQDGQNNYSENNCYYYFYLN